MYAIKGSLRAVEVCSSRVGCSLPAQRNITRGETDCRSTFTKKITGELQSVYTSLDVMEFMTASQSCLR